MPPVQHFLSTPDDRSGDRVTMDLFKNSVSFTQFFLQLCDLQFQLLIVPAQLGGLLLKH